MLTEEQAQQMKANIIRQIESTFPEDRKSQAISQVQAMSIEELEQFIEQNTQAQQQKSSQENQNIPQEQQCIFCLIVKGQIPSYKLDENKGVIAVLEINPISKGHTLIIPKKHSNKLSSAAISFASKLSKKIKTKLKPKEILTSQSRIFKHEIINIIPVYKDETLDSQRYKASNSELLEVQKLLTEKTSKKTSKKPSTKSKSIKKTRERKVWLPRRVP